MVIVFEGGVWKWQYRKEERPKLAAISVALISNCKSRAWLPAIIAEN
jgi:hypothetical protein